MHKMSLAKWTLILGVSTTLSCTHTGPQAEIPREPANATNALTDPGHTVLDAEQIAMIQNVMKQKMVKRFRDLLGVLRGSQLRVSSFDQHLRSLKSPAQVDALLASNLYCKLQTGRSRHEETEAQMLLAAKMVYQNSPTDKAWFYEQIANFAKMDASRQATVLQLVREFIQSENEICGSTGCLKVDIASLSLSIDPMDDSAFAQYLNTNKAFISKQSDDRFNDLKPGKCLQSTNRAPSQVGPYNWKERNWIGSVLPAGQFVFTYDDGPHKTYTREIRDTWAQGGMVKPSFFWLSKNVLAYPEVVRELNSQGYSISSHSERHADLGNLAKAGSAADFNGVNKQMFGPELKDVSSFTAWKNETLNREINQSVATISKFIEKPVVYFRLPYGSGTRNDLIGARFQALDLDHFFWRVDSLDWQDKNPESIRDRVVTQMKAVKSGIVLFHDVHPQSAAAAKLMVQFLQQNKSFQAVTIESLPGLRAGH